MLSSCPSHCHALGLGCLVYTSLGLGILLSPCLCILSCHSLGFSLLCRATFSLGILLPPFIITSGTSESCFLKISTSILSLYSSPCSNCTFSQSVRLSVSSRLKPEFGRIPEVLACISLALRECSPIIHTCTSTVLWMNTPCQSPHTPVSIRICTCTVLWMNTL